MSDAGRSLLGTHDFSSFRSADCQARQPVRSIKDLRVARYGDLVQIDITANGFLHNMVRIIAGSLVSIGKGKQPVGWLEELLNARDRTQAGATLPPGGLYFLQPRYPAECATFLSPFLLKLAGSISKNHRIHRSSPESQLV